MSPVSGLQHTMSVKGSKCNIPQDPGQGAAKNPTNPYFTEKLELCGYLLRQPIASNELFVDVDSFRKNLTDWLIANDDEMTPSTETDTSKFLKAMDVYITGHFKSALKPTESKTELVVASLLHCLLGIETLQPHLIKLIMPLLNQAALSETDEDKQLVHIILNQLKYLPSIVEGENFTESLLSVVDNTALNSQSLLIKELPNILPSTLHSRVIKRLLEMFSNDQGLSLNIPLMDCFSRLEIPEADWQNIQHAAVDQMNKAPLRDIPAYFSLLFQTESSASLGDTIGMIREKVELISEDPTADNDTSQIRILEKMDFCVITKPAIVTVWCELVKEDIQNGVTESIKKIDLIMLLSYVEEHELAADILKLLFTETKLAIKLFSQMIIENSPMLTRLFRPISMVLESITTNGVFKCWEAVREITIKLFGGLRSPSEAQTLVGNMTSALIHHPPSRDFVLSILTKLVEKEPKRFLSFTLKLMAVLEHVLQFTGGQIKALMNILALLAQTEPNAPDGANPFNTEFAILLHKQLTHSDIQMRCVGLFGALATIRHTTEPRDNDKIILLLKLAWSIIERGENVFCVFCDELSDSVAALPQDVCTEFADLLKAMFHKLWTLHIAETKKIRGFAQKIGLSLATSFDANGKCNEERLLIMFESQPPEMSPVVIPSHFRAMSVLEDRVKVGKSVEADPLLGSPLLLPELEEYFERDSIAMFGYNQRTILGQYLLLAINYFRESISAHAKLCLLRDSEIRAKVWFRLENISKLQKILVHHFECFPILPCAYIADKTVSLSRDDEPIPSGLQDEKGAPDLEKKIHPKKISPHLRRFHPSVFRLLCYPLQTEDREYTNFSDVSGNIRFTPETLALLLVELKVWMKQDISCELKKIPKLLCGHINSIVTTLAEHEENGTTCTPRHLNKLEDLLRLLITLMNMYFEAIQKLDQEERDEKLNSAMELLATQIVSPDGATYRHSQVDIIANVAKYLGYLFPFIQDPVTALDHIKLLKTIHDVLNGHVKLKRLIGEAVQHYLRSDEWKLAPSQVDEFLKSWLGTTSTPLEIIEKLLSTNDKNPVCSTYKTCTEENFHGWYNAMFFGLSQYAHKNLRRRDNFQEWKQPVLIFQKLVSVTKRVRQNLILASALRNCRLFLKCFVCGGLPLLSTYWAQSEDEARQFCKQLQIPCETIRHICNYSRIDKSDKLITKGALNTLNCRFREALETIPGAMEALQTVRNGEFAITGSDADSNVPWSAPKETNKEN